MLIVLHDGLRHAFERNDGVAQAGLDDRPRHAVDDAGLFRLRKDTAAARLDPCRAFAAVAAHPGHDHAEHAGAVDLGRRMEQHVHRGPVRRVERA